MLLRFSYTQRRLAEFIHQYNERRAHMGIDGLTPADRFFGRADRVLESINAISRRRNSAPERQAPAGAPFEELAEQRSGPTEALRLVIVDGQIQLRFCGAQVSLGSFQAARARNRSARTAPRCSSTARVCSPADTRCCPRHPLCSMPRLRPGRLRRRTSRPQAAG